MYRPLPDGLTIKESDVQGLGLFATKDFEADVVLGIVHIPVWIKIFHTVPLELPWVLSIIIPTIPTAKT